MKVRFGHNSKNEGPYGWKEVPELIKNSNYNLILALIIGLVMMEIFDFIEPTFVTYGKIYLLIALIPVHEALHIICFRRPLKSEIWIDLKHFMFFVTNDEVFKKSRLSISLLMPFTILTLIPIIVSLTIWNNRFLNYFALYNALASGGDFLSLYILIRAKGRYFKIVNNRLYAK